MPREARLDAPGTLRHVIVREIDKREKTAVVQSSLRFF
jgi:hypothetical protein